MPAIPERRTEHRRAFLGRVLQELKSQGYVPLQHAYAGSSLRIVALRDNRITILAVRQTKRRVVRLSSVIRRYSTDIAYLSGMDACHGEQRELWLYYPREGFRKYVVEGDGVIGEAKGPP